MCIKYHILVNMYHVSAQDVDERMINVHCYYYWWFLRRTGRPHSYAPTPVCPPPSTKLPDPHTHVECVHTRSYADRYVFRLLEICSLCFSLTRSLFVMCFVYSKSVRLVFRLLEICSLCFSFTRSLFVMCFAYSKSVRFVFRLLEVCSLCFSFTRNLFVMCFAYWKSVPYVFRLFEIC